MTRARWGNRAAWIAGIVSGAFGGLVGNQGGIRTAAMLGFHIPRESFVATATAIALFVDGARLPVYLATQGREIAAIWRSSSWRRSAPSSEPRSARACWDAFLRKSFGG